MANFMSVEMSEHRYPLRFDYFAMREDSGGAGWHRGGCGSEYGFTMLADAVTTVVGDRMEHPPFGIAGGGPAAPNYVRLKTRGEEWKPEMGSKLEREALAAGDGIRAASPGGGGFGDPLTRDLAEIERDLNLGYVSRVTAETIYGVVIAEETARLDRSRYRLDIAASETKRLALKQTGETAHASR
jgi:N-methylhydantoinase B